MMIELTNTSTLVLWEQENLWSFDEGRKGGFEKTEETEKVYLLKLQYDLDVLENSKCVYGRFSSKWASWKGRWYVSTRRLDVQFVLKVL